MKEIKSFEEIYENLQKSNSEEMNSTWVEAKKEASKKNKIILLICLIVDSIIIFISYKINNLFGIGTSIIPILFLDLFILAIASLFGNKKNIEYYKIFKDKIINTLIANFYDNLEYFPDGQMPSRIYKEGQYESYDNYYSDDYIEAKIDEKYYIDMAEVKTEREETYRDSEGHTHTKRITIFHGIFAKIINEKSINSELKIKQNGILFGKNRLKMDSNEFEKYFDVISTNKIIGMQILTPDIMELLVNFQIENKIKYDIFIKENNIYVRFDTGSVFELKSIKKGAFDEKMLREYYNILKFTYELSTKLIEVMNETEI